MKKQESGTLADLTPHASGSESGSDRAFGLVFAVVFAIIGCWPLLKSGQVRLWALALATAFLMLALVAPRMLAPLNKAWTQFGLLLGRVVSPIVLFLVYCIAVVPTAMLMRLAGKDPLRRRFEPDARTYWIPRVPVGRPDETMRNQF